MSGMFKCSCVIVLCFSCGKFTRYQGINTLKNPGFGKRLQFKCNILQSSLRKRAKNQKFCLDYSVHYYSGHIAIRLLSWLYRQANKALVGCQTQCPATVWLPPTKPNQPASKSQNLIATSKFWNANSRLCFILHSL